MYLGTQGTAISPCFVPIIIKQLSSREQPLLSHYCCKRRVSPGGRSSDRFSPHSKPYHPWNTSRLGSSPPAYHFSHFFFLLDTLGKKPQIFSPSSASSQSALTVGCKPQLN